MIRSENDLQKCMRKVLAIPVPNSKSLTKLLVGVRENYFLAALTLSYPDFKIHSRPGGRILPPPPPNSLIFYPRSITFGM